MSTFLELQDLTLDFLDDPNAGYFTRTKVKQWLNFAQEKVQKLLIKAGEGWYKTCVQTTTVANQSDYAHPDNFRKIEALVIVENEGTSSEREVPLDSITQGESAFVSGETGRPVGFFLKKRRIVLVPRPDTAYTLRLYQTYRVADMVYDTEVPDIPEEYHELIWLEAAEMGLLKDGRDTSELTRRKEKYAHLYEEDSEDRVESQPREVVVTDSY